LFYFIDCDADGFVNAENMWQGFKMLKRVEPQKYNIYNCILPNSVNSEVRTNAMNDFILKNMKQANGFVNLDEWRRGFLLGYCDRNVDDLKVYFSDDTKCKKSERWSEDGVTDTRCQRMLSLAKRN
jgi:hypothetical protein